MDLMTNVGFASTLYHATCVKAGGGFLAAPVCSSWVYLSLDVYLCGNCYFNRPLKTRSAGFPTKNWQPNQLKVVNANSFWSGVHVQFK